MFVPMLPLAGATVATAAVVTMTVLPVGVKPEMVQGPAIDSAALVAPEVPVEVRKPSAHDPGTRTVAVFGDSVAWTMMRYLPPTPGLAFTNYTTIGCGIARGGPYRYVGQTLNQKPECDAWPSRWSQRINHDRPDVVLLIVGRWEVVDRMNEGVWTDIGETGYEDYLRGELNRALDILGVDRRADRRHHRALQPACRKAGRQLVSRRRPRSRRRVERVAAQRRQATQERRRCSI